MNAREIHLNFYFFKSHTKVLYVVVGDLECMQLNLYKLNLIKFFLSQVSITHSFSLIFLKSFYKNVMALMKHSNIYSKLLKEINFITSTKISLR